MSPNKLRNIDSNINILFCFLTIYPLCISLFKFKKPNLHPAQTHTAMYQHCCLNVYHLTILFVLGRLCYVHCRTQFFHVDIFLFPVFMSHAYFRF
jgi:hypothetical protein